MPPRISTMNPANGEVIAEYELMKQDELEGVLRNSYWTFREWRHIPLRDRSLMVYQLKDLLCEEKLRLARLITTEMGKTLSEALLEIEKCAWACESYAENAEDYLADEHVHTDMSESLVTYAPLGPVLGVMPWNFPFWQTLRFAIPAILAGNSVVLKHASGTTGSALEIEDLFRRANFPEHLFRAIVTNHDGVQSMIGSELIAAVSVTGSDKTGAAIAQRAGGCLKKIVMELGGSDAYIVLEDADIESAAKTCAEARLVNNGQSCVAAKRFIVVSSVYEKFRHAFIDEMQKHKMGDPLLPESNIGPLARDDIRKTLASQVERSLREGARLALGGHAPSGNGFYFPPTVLENVKPGMAVFDEETFGPVAALVRVENEAEAFDTANKSHFGLGAAIFSGDVERAKVLATTRMEAGFCAINTSVRSDPRLPFGGIKRSGHGRELGRAGILEFVNQKTIVIA